MPKLGISYKIMVAPAIIAVFLVVYGLHSARNIWQIETLVGQLDVAVKTEQTAQEVESAVNGLEAAAFRSLVLIKQKKDQQARDLMRTQIETVQTLERTIAEGQPPDYLPRLQDYVQKVRQAHDAATTDSQLGAALLQSSSVAYDALLQELQGITASSRIAKDKAQQDFDSTLVHMQQVQIALLLLAVTVGLTVAYLMARKISGPLLEIREGLAEIERSGRLAQRVPVRTEDEVGQTARSINAVLDSVQSGLGAVNQTVQALAEGDFSQRAQVQLRGDLADMMASVNQTVESLSQTMHGLNQVMASMSQGQFSTQVTIHAQGSYQVTAETAIATLRNLERMLGDIGQVMQAVSQGDLTLRVTAQGQGDLDLLKQNINLSLDSLGKAMAAINQNARQVAAAASESSQAIGQISDGAQNQTHGISQVAAAVRQTAASVADVSRNTELASQKSRQSVAVLRDGLTKIERMVEVVNNIAASSEKINKITEVIEKIANKTNLLSLNAAIEAARAGEHGKGFAVVADEVGKLAVNSAESSKEIATLVQQAVLETAKAVTAVQAVSADMTQIEMGSMETDNMLRRIASSLEEQSTAVEQINANLGNMDAIARSNAAASEEITATVMELARIADATRQEVGRFRL